jgi:hypothetical protein
LHSAARVQLQSQITASARRCTQHEEGGAHNIRRRETQPQAGQCRRRRRWLSYSAPASARGAGTVGGVRCSLVPLAGICYCAAADGASQAAQTISSKKQECKDSLRDKNARVLRAGGCRSRSVSCRTWPQSVERAVAAAAPRVCLEYCPRLPEGEAGQQQAGPAGALRICLLVGPRSDV